MGSWISKDGIQTPAREKVALYDEKGEPYIYEGPDRSAVQYLKETNQEHLGVHFTEDPEIIERAHERKMSIDDFCKTKIHTKEKRQAHFDEASKQVVTHKSPSKSNDTNKYQSGGMNTAGSSGHLEGGFDNSGDDPRISAVRKVAK